MYEAFYGLSSRPFQLNPDPHFYFGSKQHRRAKAYLDYGVSRNDGFIVITGEVGAGKTTILRDLIENLAHSNIVAGQLVTTQLDAEDTLRMVGAAFGVPIQGVPKAELLSSLEAFLVTQTSQGKRCLLIVDEAQNLTPRAVEELRMLSNFQLGNQALLQSFLVGQPEFREILQRPEMEQFRQRVAATCHIGPLDIAEIEAYVNHRLQCAGSTGEPAFDPEAFAVIHQASQGIPRRINSICDRVLLLGYMENRKHLTVEDVNEVVREFVEESTIPPSARGGLGRPVNGVDRVAHVPALQLDPDITALDQDTVDGMSRQLSELDVHQHGEQLRRLEQGMLRLERLNVQSLAVLQELVRALSKPRPGNE
ncbi:MAG: XrtA/PEP-CTERM system-associated ATPase [Burkholderiaceae bacterium]